MQKNLQVKHAQHLDKKKEDIYSELVPLICIEQSYIRKNILGPSVCLLPICHLLFRHDCATPPELLDMLESN